MKVYGIDQSLRGCGHTVLDDGEQVFTERIEAGDRVGFDRVKLALSHIAPTIEKFQPDVIVMENYAYGASTNNITKLAELGGVIKWEIFNRGYQTGRDAVLRGEKVFFTQAQGKMKKFCLGNGATKKDSGYLLAVFDRIKRRFSNDDEADAYMHAWMASIVVGVIRGQVQIGNLTSYQQEALIEQAAKARKGLSITKALKLPEEEKQRLAQAMELTA